MKLSNIEQLRNLIKNHKSNVIEGYVCLGYGMSIGFDSRFDLDPKHIYRCNDDNRMSYNWAGSDPEALYYVKQDIYDQYIADPSFSNTIEDAMSLMGKYVSFTDDNGKDHELLVTEWTVFQKSHGPLTNKVIEKYGYSVNVGGKTFNTPVASVTLSPSKSLEISKDYTAKITKGKVEVGCQTIDIETVRKIIELHDSL